MRKSISFFFALCVIAASAVADIIPPNSHAVDKCIKITNTAEYPDVAVLGFIESVMSQNRSYLVDPTSCLSKDYKFNTFSLYATTLAYLSGKDVAALDLPNISVALKSNITLDPSGGYVADSDPINRIEEYYKIIGFNKTSIFLYKWKQVTGYNNGSNDLIETFPDPTDLGNIQQAFPTSIVNQQEDSDVIVFPNPASSGLNVSIENSYIGLGSIALLSIDGKVVKSVSINKQSTLLQTRIDIESCSKGNYMVVVTLGDSVVSKKIAVE